MYVLKVRNVNYALFRLMNIVQRHGEKHPSRAGDVLVLPEPVTTIYNSPQERVLFSPARDANPFFHLIEALWMLAGKSDLKTVEFFVKRMRDFSDDGWSLHGAYGRRWRNWFTIDQLDHVVELLTNHPNSRRAIIQMWDPENDLHVDEDMKDLPCNVTCHVQLNKDGELDLTVFCRSNDLIWGATGANAVHFSILQEYLAARIGASIGRLYQISNNAHVYRNVFDNLIQRGYLDNLEETFYGSLEQEELDVVPDVIVKDPKTFDYELQLFFKYFDEDLSEINNLLQARLQPWTNPIFPEVALPMVAAYQIFRRDRDPSRYDEMLQRLSLPADYHPHSDWLAAARAWVRRRQEAFERAKDDGVRYD